MNNPLADSSIPLEVRVACSNAALAYAAAAVTYQVLRSRMISAMDVRGAAPTKLHQETIDAEREATAAHNALIAAVASVASHGA